MESLFIKGLIVGFCLAVPLGPIAALCIQRTTMKGWPSGLASGLGAALADAFYGAMAAIGVTVISGFLISHQSILQRVAGVVLCILGTRLLLARPPHEEMKINSAGLLSDAFSTLLLTLTNPMTFIAFAAVFANLGVGLIRARSILTVELVSGVFLGSAAWWLILVGLVGYFRDRFHPSTIVWVNRGLGAFVIVVGVLYIFVIHPSSEPTPLR